MISRNLVNSAHIYSADKSRSLGIWVEERPSRFLFFGKYRPVNEYLRMTWAIGFLGKDAVPLFCPRCYREFSTARQLQDHGYRHRGTCVEKEAKKRQRPQIK
jgi:hypothetical protein